MKFHFFQTRAEGHVRKSLDYLSEAYLAWVEHQAAAEHHAALAKMYSERIARTEAEVRNSHQHRADFNRPQTDDTYNGVDDLRSKPESVVVYPTRASRQ